MRFLLLFALSPPIVLGYLLFLMSSIHLGDEDIEQLLNRIDTLGGRDGNLLNFKEIDKTKGARANDGSS